MRKDADMALADRLQLSRCGVRCARYGVFLPAQSLSDAEEHQEFDNVRD